MVDGEIVGSDEERLELRWIDALRAPGAPGGYRTVVDVVEGRRSGRLTVVNGGRDSDDNVRRGYTLGLGAESENVDGVFAPRNGRPSYRGMVEEEMRMRGRYREMMGTPVRRKPVPVSCCDVDMRGDESPLALRNRRGRGRAMEQREEGGVDGLDVDVDGETFARYRWRRGGPRGRPPIPSFESRGVTERELLDEVEDARRILESGGLVGGVEDKREEEGGLVDGGDGKVGGVEDRREEEGREVREGSERVIDVEEKGKEADEERGTEEEEGQFTEVEEVVCEDGNGKEQDEEDESDSEAMDFFWVDEEGDLEYRRCRLPL